ncbi:MAG: nucleotidyl transferase AbiEii/AbiGii toxin family protein [Chitinivibrionales bacterium]|nr:nucleotidyl transferase AbiEii/AbiGii toxin family protein [Chitinivibrionales bacterium]
MRLHEEKNLFRQAILATSQQLRILEIFIEKDYWVTYALKQMFRSEMRDQIIFKGGTALSKCFRLIERFSEDIDLILKHDVSETDNQMKSKLRNISQIIGAVMPEVNIDGMTLKRGMNRKTAHSYPQIIDGRFGQVRNCIILEATWLGHFEPYMPHTISSYIFEMMERNSQTKLAEEYDLLPFDGLVLCPIRTFCEKIMSLIRFSYSDHPIHDLKKKIRHVYDLHQILGNYEIQVFFNSEDFPRFLLSVAQDDVKSFRNNNKWLKNHPRESLFFGKLEEVWRDLLPLYTGEFKELVYGELPTGDAVLKSMQCIRDSLIGIDWTIEL